MATSVRRRSTAVLALAMASGVTLAAAIPAGAATAAPPAYYQGVTSANVLGVALHLPAALPALPNIPKDLAVNLIGVSGNAVHDTLSGVEANTSTAVSSLASGSLIDALPAQLGLKKTLTATLSSDPSQSVKSDSAIPHISAKPLIDVSVGDLLAKALRLENTSTSSLTNGTILDLGSLLQIPAAGTTLLNTVTNTLNSVDVQGKVDAAVQQVESAVNGLLANEPTGTTAALANQVEATVKTVQDKVNAFLADLQNKVAGTAVVKIDLLDASQHIAPNAAGAAQAQSLVNLAGLDILNGVLKVQGFQSGALAWSDGKHAFAKPMDKKPIVTVGVSNVLTATLDDTGLSLDGVPALGDQVNSALKTLQSTLNTLLGALGVQMAWHPGTSSVSSNGKHAEATGGEYDIVVANPLDKTALVEVGLGHGTTASVSAAQATRHVQLSNPKAGPGIHPHTGANLPLIAGGGLALLLGAGYLRRRQLV